MRQNRGREHQPPLLPSTFRLPSAELRWKAPKRSHFCLFVLFFFKKKGHRRYPDHADRSCKVDGHRHKSALLQELLLL